MSDQKDQNHIFPEPNFHEKKDFYRPVLANDSSPLHYLEKEEQTNTTVNSNISFKGVIKDISNTNLEALKKIKTEEPEKIIIDPVNKDQTLEDNKDPKDKKIITFDVKKKFSETKFGQFLKKFWWLIAILAILFLALGYFAVQSYLENNKSAPILTKVETKIDGPESAPKSGLKIWNISVKNDDAFSMKDVTLEMEYDRDFKISKLVGDFKTTSDKNNSFAIGTIPTGSKKILTIEGKLEAQIDVVTKRSGKLKFYVDGFDKNKQTVQTINLSAKDTKIEKSIIRLDITSDSRVPKESDQDIKIDFTNQSGKVINNFRLKMKYPELGTNFVYQSSEFFLPGKVKQLVPSVGDHTWNITSLDNNQTGSLIIKSKIKGNADDKLTFIAELISIDDNNVLNKAEKEVIVVDKALTIKPIISMDTDYLLPDKELVYTISVKNNYNQELKNLKISAFFIDNAELIDPETIAGEVGSPIINKAAREVSFTSAGVKSLQRMGPKAEELFEFRFKLKPLIAFTNSKYTQDNFFIQPKVSVTGDNFQSQSEIGDIKRAKGGPELIQSVEFLTDGTKRIAKVTWSIKNKFSNLKEFKVRTTTPLPSNSWNQASITPSSSSDSIKYNPVNGEIIWDKGDVEAYTGYNGKEAKITFTLVNSTDSKINFVEAPTYSTIDTLNQGSEFNQINTPITGGGPVSFQQ